MKWNNMQPWNSSSALWMNRCRSAYNHNIHRYIKATVSKQWTLTALTTLVQLRIISIPELGFWRLHETVYLILSVLETSRCLLQMSIDIKEFVYALISTKVPLYFKCSHHHKWPVAFVFRPLMTNCVETWYCLMISCSCRAAHSDI